jgi:hypothetical protein
MKKRASKKTARSKASRKGSRTKDLPATTATAVRGGTTWWAAPQTSTRADDVPLESISFAYQKVKVG